MPRLPPGEILGQRFEILGVLGEGGMATVYLAQDRLRGEQVALKLLHRHLATSPSMRARLRREVVATSHLRHPNALVAHELHELDGLLGLSMPVCAGATLADHVAARGPMEVEALRRLGLELSSVLAHAHGHGVVHRDVTPNNAMIAPGGEALLMDFGLARLEGGRTATGTGVLGTAGYAAPEVFDGVRGDPRSDLYSLGAVLYFAATGKAPFAAPTPMATLKRQLADDRVPVSEARPDLPPELANLVEALLQTDPEQRPAGASAVHDALLHGGLSEEAPVPAAFEVVDPLSLSPRLPPGPWSLELKETEKLDLDRRARQRAGLDPHGVGLEGVIRRFVTELADGVRSALSLPAQVPVEAQLMQSVARQADLPPEALRLSPELFEERFLLVAGVDEPTARALEDSARLLGFKTRLHQERAAQRTGPMDPRSAAILAASLIGLAILTHWSLAVVGFVLLVLSLAGVPLSSATARLHPALPVAYHDDLRADLTPDYLEALEALETRHAEANRLVDQQIKPQRTARQAAAAPHPAPAEAARPVPPAGRRATAQLDALESTLQRRAPELPPVVVEDLTRSLHQLRARCLALTERAHVLREELDAPRSAAAQDAAAAAAQVEGRLERLKTLTAMGHPADPQEQARLEAALAGHREAMEAQERLESDYTRALAELLEIGASASRARRSLLEDVDVVSSATDLLGELQGKVNAARAASSEVESAEDRQRRARAAQAAKQKQRR